jgi:hypothetical protein
MKTITRVQLSLVIAATLSGPALANNSLNQACIDRQASSQQQRICEGYIAGFLEGALLTDSAIVNNFLDEKSSFFQRAYRTRAIRGKDVLPPTYLAQFCLPTSSTAEQTTQIMAALDDQALQQKPLQHVVYETVRKLYPCQ